MNRKNASMNLYFLLPSPEKCDIVRTLTAKVNCANEQINRENEVAMNGEAAIATEWKHCMNEKFFELKKEKQDRMINASLKIFGLRGYQFASTDDIVKEAGISKGLLFHYFGSKSGLYSFIYDYSVRYMSLELKAAVSPTETDFFSLQKQMEAGRLQVLKNYPCMQLFLEKCNHENMCEALLATEEKKQEFAALCDSFDAQADPNLLPVGTDIQKLRNILRYAFRCRMADCFASGSFQPEMFYRENIAYIEFLEKLFER